MKLTIGVMGTSDAILITGARPGLPFEAVRGAKAAGGLVVGISPGSRSTSTAENTGRPSRVSTS